MIGRVAIVMAYRNVTSNPNAGAQFGCHRRLISTLTRVLVFFADIILSAFNIENLIELNTKKYHDRLLINPTCSDERGFGNSQLERWGMASRVTGR